MRCVRGDEQVPIGVEGSDIDSALAHTVKNVARGHKITGHRTIKRGAFGRAVGEEMMAKRIESGLGMRNRPTRARAERVRKRAVRRVLPHDEVRTIQRTTRRPRSARDWGCDGNDRCKLHSEGETAHEGAT